ncbi:unnamed protein product [Amaranthus hypochondriacus]
MSSDDDKDGPEIVKSCGRKLLFPKKYAPTDSFGEAHEDNVIDVTSLLNKVVIGVEDEKDRTQHKEVEQGPFPFSPKMKGIDQEASQQEARHELATPHNESH